MRVTIEYFKQSGKWYTTDHNVEWPEDPNHYDGWKQFSEVVRIKGMYAVCMGSPMGYPQMYTPPTYIEDIECNHSPFRSLVNKSGEVYAFTCKCGSLRIPADTEGWPVQCGRR